MFPMFVFFKSWIQEDSDDSPTPNPLTSLPHDIQFKSMNISTILHNLVSSHIPLHGPLWTARIPWNFFFFKSSLATIKITMLIIILEWFSNKENSLRIVW